MNYRHAIKAVIRLALVSVVVAVALLSGMLTYDGWNTTRSPEEVLLTVTMLDVGQGDAIHIRDVHGVDLLIDGGRGEQILQQLARTLPWSDRTIEYVLLTHPDADHVEGLVHVLDRYQVRTILTTHNRAGTQVDTSFAQRWSAAESIEEIQQGSVIYGEDWRLEILWPRSNCIGVHEKEDSNTYCEHDRNDRSVVAKLIVQNKTSVLLTGDIEREAEKALLTLYDEDMLKADILKVAHHGSTTSSYGPLMDIIQPVHALISAGKENAYGHPHASTIQMLDDLGVHIWRTDVHGAVQCRVYVGDVYECRSVEEW